MKYNFYASLEKEGHFYKINFPDFPDIEEYGDGLEEAIDTAEEELGRELIMMEAQKITIPKPSSYQELFQYLSPDSQLQLIFVNTEVARAKARNKSVNKMVTLPEYLVALGKEQKLNFSQILQKSLKEELHIINEKSVNDMELNFEVAMENIKFKSPSEIAIGFDDNFNIKTHDFSTDGNILMAGTTGTGKTVIMNQMILSGMMKHSSNDLKFVIYHPQLIDFKAFEKTSFLYSGILHDESELEIVLSKIKSELHYRQRQLSEAGYNDIDTYNQHARNNGLETFSHIIVAIDEFFYLFTQNDNAGTLIKKIAELGNELGVHFIMSTQNIRPEYITEDITQYLSSRIAFKLPNEKLSKLILNEVGAEKLKPYGSMLYKKKKGNSTKLQGDYISDEKIEDICANL